MRNKKSRNIFRCSAVLALTAALTLSSPMASVSAESISKYVPSTATETTHSCVIHLIDADTNTTLKTYYGNVGDSYGPGPDQAVSVRDTYYDSKSQTDYDLSYYEILSGDRTRLGKWEASDLNKGAHQIDDQTAEINLYYKKHSMTNADRTITLQAVTEDGTVLQYATLTINQDQTIDPSEKLGKSFSYKGVSYQAPSKHYDISYSGDDVQKITYQKSKNSKNQYYVTVNYVDDSDSDMVITQRSFYVNKKDYIFTAPKVFSVQENGSTVTYIFDKKKNNNSYTIHHKLESTQREYTVHYVREEKQSSPLTFTVLQYDSYSNECIGLVQKEVAKGESITFDPKKNLPKGTGEYSYKVNSSFDKTIHYTYGDSNRTVYIYYDRYDSKDPDKYSTKARSREVTFRYQAVDETVEGHEIIPDEGQAKTKMTVVSNQDSSYSLSQEITAGGQTYVLIQGQVNPVEISYYSPRDTYTFYYKNKNDVNFYTIRTETTEEVEVLDNNVTWTIIPGITRVIITNQTTGVTNTVGTFGLNGQAIGGNGNGGNAGGQNAANNANGGANQNAANNQVNGGSDQGIDGIDSDEIQTPRGNIDLDKDQNASAKMPLGLIFACIGAVAVLAVLLIHFLKKRKHSVMSMRKHEAGEEEKDEK